MLHPHALTNVHRLYRFAVNLESQLQSFTSPRQDGMQEEQIHTPLVLNLDTSRSGRLYSHLIGGWLGPRAGLDFCRSG
jgi:hypothetical protein